MSNRRPREFVIEEMRRRRARRWRLLLLGMPSLAALLLALFMYAKTRGGWTLLVIGVAGVGIIASIAMTYMNWRCPACGKGLGHVQHGFCPNCGTPLD